MKPAIRSLTIGQKIWALVEESIANEELVINLDGDLIRVANKSNRKLRFGERVQLQVTQLSPLTLALVQPTVRSNVHIFERTI